MSSDHLISGWGRFPKREAQILNPRTQTEIAQCISSSSLIPRGMGRSYGDSANASTVLESSLRDHFIAFDANLGVIECEAGVSINQLLSLIVPQAWFIPVTPGSSFVSIGGAIASDVHGKNHHLHGSFSEHVISFDLMLASGEVLTVSRASQSELFRATCGGMGLTGVILSAKLQLQRIQSSRVVQRTHVAASLDEVCAQFTEFQDSTYSVAWIDCLAKGKSLGRSILMLGEHAQDEIFEDSHASKLNIPIDFPNILLNPYSIKAFNTLYFHKHAQSNQEQILPYEKFFYPLDSIANWNRMYGKAGFIQYQFCLPLAAGVEGLRCILKEISESGKGSFLAVLKRFGKQNANYLSFPMEGLTLALDFKVDAETFQLISKLDAMVQGYGGRVYLTKDALMSLDSFRAFYPEWEAFQAIREKYGAIGRFASDQSRRLGL